jgi:hypothetical protein
MSALSHVNRSRESYTPPLKACSYCGREFRFLGLHTRVCRHESNTEFDQAYSDRLSERSKLIPPVVWTKASRKKLRESMRRVVSQRPNSYSGENRWKQRPTVYSGEKFVSSWEVRFAKACDCEGISWVKNRRGFSYRWRGERTYFPDFYIKYFRVYVEIKGKRSERDRHKWEQFEPNLLVITRRGMREMAKSSSCLRAWLRKTRRDDGSNYLIL